MSATIVLDWYECKKEERKRGKKRPPNGPDLILFLVLAIFLNLPLSGLLGFSMDVMAIFNGDEFLSISYIDFITLYVSSIALLFLLICFIEKHPLSLERERTMEFLKKWGELIDILDIPFMGFSSIGLGMIPFALYSAFFEGGSELSIRTGYISIAFSYLITYSVAQFLLKKKGGDKPSDKE